MKITVPSGVIRALLLFAAKVDVRFYLQGVYVDINYLIATDGARLLRVPFAPEGIPDRPFIIPRAPLEIIARGAKKI